MVDRRFTEVDLRTMLQLAQEYRQDVVPQRWVIEARFEGRSWEIVVEPEPERATLVVVTAYPVD